MRIAGLFLSLGLLSGCLNNYSRITPVTVPSVNYAVMETPKLQLLTFSGVEYDIKVKQIDSLFISGAGRKRMNAAGEWQRGKYRVAVDSVEYLILKQTSGASMMLALVSTAQIMHLIAARPVGSSKGVSDRLDYQPDGSSCPYLYKRDEQGQWQLKAEAFGSGFGKALEIESRYVLAEVNPAGAEIALRLSNERPETHYVNRVGFKLYSLPGGGELAAGTDGKYYRYRATAPLKVSTPREGDVSSRIRERDDLYYRGTEKGRALNGYRDVLEIPLDPGRQTGLLVTGRNSYLSSAVMDGLFGFLGDQSLRFYRAIEKDPYWIGQMKKWRDRAALKVFYKNAAGNWKLCGRVMPEATEVDFTRILPLPGEATAIRLVSLADVWHINHIALAREVAAVQGAERLAYGGESPLLKEDDRRYDILLPGDERHFTLRIPATEKGGKRFLVAEIKGYLHEGYMEREQSALLPPMGRANRLVAFGRLIDKEAVYLPLLYRQWRRHPLYLER